MHKEPNGMNATQTISYTPGLKWGPADAAVEAYECTLAELVRWLSKGLVYGYYKRGANGGWLMPIAKPTKCATELSMIEKRFDAA